MAKDIDNSITKEAPEHKVLTPDHSSTDTTPKTNSLQNVAHDIIPTISEERLEFFVNYIKKIHDEKEHDDKEDELLELVRAKFEEIQSKIHDLRKQGHFMFIPGLMIKYVPPLIEYYRITRAKQDYDRCMAHMNETLQEIDEALKDVPVTVAKDLLMQAQQESMQQSQQPEQPDVSEHANQDVSQKENISSKENIA